MIMLILTVFFTSGCWDSKDIEQKDIHISETIDFKNNQYVYYGEVANLSGEKAGSGSSDKKEQSGSVHIISAEGDTFIDARNNLEQKSSKTVYLGACRLLIFTHRLADKSLEEYLNRSRFQTDSRKSLKVVTTSAEPESLLATDTDNSLSVGLAIDDSLEKMIQDGTAISVDIGNVIEILAVKKAGFIIPDINMSKSRPTITGYTVFKDTKIQGVIPIEQSNGIVFFLNPKAAAFYEIDFEGRKYILKASVKNKSIKPSYQDSKLKLSVTMKFTAEIQYADKATVINKETLQGLQVLLADFIKKDIVQTLQVSQKQYQTDYLNIYKYFRAKYNSDFKNLDWQQLYASSETSVSVNASIKTSKLPIK